MKKTAGCELWATFEGCFFNFSWAKKKNLITYNKAKLYYALFFTATLLALLLSFYLSTDLERNLLISKQLCSDLLEYGFAKQMCIPLSSGIAKNTIDYINLTSSFYIFLQLL